jgi:hypothetical protein
VAAPVALENLVMMKRIMPLCCVALLCALSLAPLAQSAGGTGARGDLATFADANGPDFSGLTDADREVLQASEQASDPRLEDLRGGHGALVVVAVILIFLLIIAIVS